MFDIAASRGQALAFSFARAIQQPTLESWKEEAAQMSTTQNDLHHRAKCDRAARQDENNAAMEKIGA